MDFLSINSKFYQVLYKISDLIILSVLWVLTSLPVITIFVSGSALYYSILKVVREDENPAIKTYFAAFRDNFKQGMAIFGLLLGVFAAVSLVGSAVYLISGSASVLPSIYTVYQILALLALGWLHYVLSYIAKFQAPLAAVLKNSLAICVVNLPATIAMVMLFMVIVGGWALLLPRSAMFLLLLPGVYAYVTSFLTERIFQKYMPAETEE